MHNVLYCSDVNDPNGLQQKWPEYTVVNQEYIVFQTGNSLPIRQRMRDENVHFWNEVVPAIRNSKEQCNNRKINNDVNGVEQMRVSTIMLCVAISQTHKISLRPSRAVSSLWHLQLLHAPKPTHGKAKQTNKLEKGDTQNLHSAYSQTKTRSLQNTFAANRPIDAPST